jgi:hypothetical protein
MLASHQAATVQAGMRREGKSLPGRAGVARKKVEARHTGACWVKMAKREAVMRRLMAMSAVTRWVSAGAAPARPAVRSQVRSLETTSLGFELVAIG